jgi:hypothetical protein
VIGIPTLFVGFGLLFVPAGVLLLFMGARARRTNAMLTAAPSLADPGDADPSAATR